MLGLFIELVHDYIYLNTFGCRVAPVPPPPAPATGRLESYRVSEAAIELLSALLMMMGVERWSGAEDRMQRLACLLIECFVGPWWVLSS